MNGQVGLHREAKVPKPREKASEQTADFFFSTFLHSSLVT